jgi:hypothetical protein
MLISLLFVWLLGCCFIRQDLKKNAIHKTVNEKLTYGTCVFLTNTDSNPNIALIFHFLKCFRHQSSAFIIISDLLHWVPRLERGEGQDLSEVLEKVLGYGKLSREKFFEIIEMTKKRGFPVKSFAKS